MRSVVIEPPSKRGVGGSDSVGAESCIPRRSSTWCVCGGSKEAKAQAVAWRDAQLAELKALTLVEFQSRTIRSNLVFGRRYRRSSWSSKNRRHEIPVTCPFCRDPCRAASRAARTVSSEMTRLRRSGGGDFISKNDLVVVVRDRLPGDASKATKARL